MKALENKSKKPQTITHHIFQKTKVTLNKMEPKKGYHFLTQFFMAFLVVWFVLFCMLAFVTSK